MTALLALRHVLHRYNGKTVLDIRSLDFDPGSITGLVGPNGSGKTTLLKILSLVENCSSGTVLFQGKASHPYDDRTRYRITLLLQEPYLLKRSVFDNIAYGLKLRGATSHIEKDVKASLELVGLPTPFGRRQWNELSGGEAQRVALAARLALRPDCLLLDEPTASVDLQSAERIKRAILLAREEWGTTIVISSHQRHWLQTICDSIIFLTNGRILPFSPENIFSGPWQNGTDGRKIKTLADEQQFFLPSVDKDDCAALPPAAIRVVTENNENESDNILSGRITAIFEKGKSPGMLNLHALCGEQQFILEMPADSLRKKQLQTGQAIKIAFSSQDIFRLPG